MYIHADNIRISQQESQKIIIINGKSTKAARASRTTRETSTRKTYCTKPHDTFFTDVCFDSLYAFDNNI